MAVRAGHRRQAHLPPEVTPKVSRSNTRRRCHACAPCAWSRMARSRIPSSHTEACPWRRCENKGLYCFHRRQSFVLSFLIFTPLRTGMNEPSPLDVPYHDIFIILPWHRHPGPHCHPWHLPHLHLKQRESPCSCWGRSTCRRQGETMRKGGRRLERSRKGLHAMLAARWGAR